MSGDPVSWLLIEPGWSVCDAGGDEVGRVEEVVGDSGIDIFNGLAISTGLLGSARYVPAEVIGSITEGSVQLRLSRDEVKNLGAYEEPPPSEEFVP
jgi:Uncharacterized protein conserved in bacteria (DUF2171)